MTASGKIKVRKRDGSLEAFAPARLASTMARGLARTGGPERLGRDLARAVELYLRRCRRTVVSSTALFEMAVKALRRVCMGEAAEVIELHRTLRAVRRPLLRVRHDGGQVTTWDKSWVALMGERTWGLSRRTARIFAGEIELHLLPQQSRIVDRQDVIALLNERVVQFGLADAVPVRQYVPQE